MEKNVIFIAKLVALQSQQLLLVELLLLRQHLPPVGIGSENDFTSWI